MPSATHPQAKFDPIPPDLDLNTLVENTANFDYVSRISVAQIKELGIDEFEKVVLHHVIIGGKPLVVDGWGADLPPWLFSPTWLIENVGTKPENVRDIGQSTNMPMTIGHYIKSMGQLTRNMTPRNFRDPKRQRLYLKDIDCPEAWYDKLEELMPQQLFYYNESVGEKGGLGAVRERNSFGQMILGKGAAPAGDLMSSLPPEMRAQNFMCYIGHEGTYTPAHREMCASLGQNIMVETSDVDTGEAPGSSIWFMTESKDREVVSEYFLSMLGHDIEIETHFAQINAWKKAPFPVYIVEQKVGDFILIPPLAPHQVWNRGTRTMKAAWNRTTVETLELAINEALPRARLVCRDEQYKNKAIIYYTLQKYSDLLDRVEAQGGQIQYNEYGQRASQSPTRVKQLQRDFRRLFDLFTTVMVTEMFDPGHPEKKVEFVKYDSNVTCSYCRCNIFNRFLTCKSCIITSDDGEIEDTYDICLECYAMGRSCACISNLVWVEQWKWLELTSNHEKWRSRVISILTSQAIDGQIDPETSPQPLNIMRKRFGKTPVAQICQEQLKLRPFRDPSKPYVPEPLPGDSDVEPEADDEGNPIKKKMTKKMSEHRKKTHKACHICKKAEEKWKLAFCSECAQAYCYGVLYRAFDLMPQTVMEQADWKCPKCRKICSCGSCRKDRRQKPYQPKGTLLGHDTKKVADIRSVEVLVDFSRTNLGWLREEGDDDPQSSQRMKKLVSKAIEEKSRGDDMDDAAGDEDPQFANGTGGLIDPRLGGGVVAPVAPMYANAYEEAGLLSNPQVPEYDRYGINGHAEHDDSFNPLYPEPPEFGGRDRVMGAGYYLQQPGPEAILYVDPESGSQGEQNGADMDYPKLPAKEPDPIVYNKAKRKRPSVAKSTPRATDDAHLEYIQAQKKQKLADARASNKFYMTQNQLEGGDPLIVKLQVPKDFLDDLKTRSSKKARPTRASLRAEVAEENEDMKIPNAVKSDVRPIIINSDDEFDLALQAMNNFKSSKSGSSVRPTNGIVKRGAQKPRGTRGIAKTATRTSRRRLGSSEEVEQQTLNEATPSNPQSDDDVTMRPSTTSRGRPKSASKPSHHEDVEEDFVPSSPVGRAERQRRRAKSTDDEAGSAYDQIEKPSIRRPAGKRPSRAPKFTQAEVLQDDTEEDEEDEEDKEDEDEDHERISTSTRRPTRAATRPSVMYVPSDSEELEVVEKPVPKKRGRPPRQTKSLGAGIMGVEEPTPRLTKSGRPDRRQSAPVAKMISDEQEEEESEEIPETQYTNSFTPLNRREIGGRLTARIIQGSPASQSRRSVRFEETPDEPRDSPPRRFAAFDDGDSQSSSEPIDYSIFEDNGTVLVNGDDNISGSIFPRGNQHIDEDEDGDIEMKDHQEPIIVAEKKIVNKKSNTAAPNPRAKRGRPARKSSPIMINDSDTSSSHDIAHDQNALSYTLSKTISQEQPLPATVESDREEISSSKTISQEIPPPTPIESSEEDSIPERSVSRFSSIASKTLPAMVQEEAESDVSSVAEARSPTPPKSAIAKAPEKLKAPAKVMTEEERIIEENRRAKQAILAGLENDGYSSEYYSASEYEEREPDPEPEAAKLVEKSKAKTASTDDNRDEVHSVSPYFSKSRENTTIVAKSSNNTKEPEPSAVAKKFSRSVLAASKIDQKRKPGFMDSPATAKPGSSTPMLSLADKRAAAGKKTSFSVLPADKVARDKFGNLLKKAEGSRGASAFKASPAGGTNSNGLGQGSGLKRVPGVFKTSSSAKPGEYSGVQDSDDDDESDTSIPAVRRNVIGPARRGGGHVGMLDGSRGARTPRGRGRPRVAG